MAISYPGQVTLSPDGRYWWDGTTWVPVATTPAGAPAGPGPAVRAYGTAGPALSPDGSHVWNGVTWIPVGTAAQPDWTAARATAPSRSAEPAIGGWISLAGAVTLVIGSFLPWATLNLGVISIGRSGTDAGDGWFFIGGAVIVAVLAQSAIRGRTAMRIGVTLGILGALAALLLGYEWHDVARVAQPDSTNPFATSLAGLISYGSGLYVLAAGTVAVIIGGLAEYLRAARAHMA